MSGRHVYHAFEQFKKARVEFVTSVADLASRPHNVEYLEKSGALELLRPLLTDSVPAVQQMAAVAIGRLGNSSEKFAFELLDKRIITELLQLFHQQQTCFKKAALFILRAIAKHSAKHAQGVVDNGGLTALIQGLQDSNTEIKEAAAWAIGYIARHNTSLAKNVVDAGALPSILSCLYDKKLTLKQVGAAALCDITKHNYSLAQQVVDTGIVRHMVKHMEDPDIKFKRQLLAVMGNIARHGSDLAEHVLDSDVLLEIFNHMAHPDADVRKNAATVIREITKHSLEMSQVVTNNSGAAALLEMITQSHGETRLPAIVALGNMAGQSAFTALNIIKSKGEIFLSRILDEENQTVKAATAWTLGNIGRHSPEHVRALSEAGVLKKLLDLYQNPKNSNDLRIKSKEAVKLAITQCSEVEDLDVLFRDVSPVIMKYLVRQFSKILPHDLEGRRKFVTLGCLRRLQHYPVDEKSKVKEYINIINGCFPEEIVRYYSPGYPQIFLEQLEKYTPQVPSHYDLSKEPSEADQAMLGMKVPKPEKKFGKEQKFSNIREPEDEITVESGK
ncbi:sperm-associated antigen 6 [Anabrus simplex]|uniref:sperm-associated antigen 6 n=1 Tax=Anabrus simplex TaxID=316456 RepID=UPI0035A353A8